MRGDMPVDMSGRRLAHHTAQASGTSGAGSATLRPRSKNLGCRYASIVLRVTCRVAVDTCTPCPSQSRDTSYARKEAGQDIKRRDSQALFPEQGVHGTLGLYGEDVHLQTFLANCHRYPYVGVGFPGLQLLHAEPPVFMITDFLSPNHCQALIKAAERNQLSEAQYNDAVLFDYQRLTPLCLVVLAGTTVDVLHCLASGTSTEGITENSNDC